MVVIATPRLPFPHIVPGMEGAEGREEAAFRSKGSSGAQGATEPRKEERAELSWPRHCLPLGASAVIPLSRVQPGHSTLGWGGTPGVGGAGKLE